MDVYLWSCKYVSQMDNGGQFANNELLELGNQFGISMKHTAAYAPWANGINECNHASIDI